MKPVFVCLQGSSISDIADHLPRLLSLDVLWASLNRFDILEQKLDIKFDIVWLSSVERLHQIRYTPSHIVNHTQSLYAFGFSSLFAFLCYLIKKEYKDIYLFGADGGTKSDKLYFAEDDMKENIEERKNSIYKDTLIMNDLFWKLIDYWGVGNKNTVNIYNVNNDSLLTCFRTIKYKDLVNYI